MRSLFIAGGLVAAVQAFTPPTTASWGPLTKPDLSSPVTQGETYEVTWDPESHPTDGVTVSLVLCRGPSSNCVPDSTALMEGVPAAAKSISWTVACDLPAGTQATDSGYGMLIIVDGTGEFQYSTQFSVLASDNCGSTSSSASAPASSSASASASSISSGYGPGMWSTKSGWGSSYAMNSTSSMSSYTMSSVTVPSSVVYATSTGLYSADADTSSSIPTATFAAPEASASTFTGAAAMPTGNAGVLRTCCWRCSCHACIVKGRIRKAVLSIAHGEETNGLILGRSCTTMQAQCTAAVLFPR